MLQATVLGSGAFPGHVLHARKARRPTSPCASPSLTATDPSSSSSSSPQHHLASPRSLRPSRPFDKHRIDNSSYADEALTWSGAEVTWSRGVEVVRRYTFYHENQEVTCATFAWFHRYAEAEGESVAAANEDVKPPAAREATFGPFHKGHLAKWTEKAPPRPVRPGLYRALVVCLENKGYIYLATGEAIVFNIPLLTEACWPLPSGGILIQRALEPRRRHGREPTSRNLLPPRLSLGASDRSITDSIEMVLDEQDARELPRLYTLTDLFGEFRRVTEVTVLGGLGENTAPPRLAPLLAPPPFIKPSVRVLYIAPEPYPFVVAWDKEDASFIVYRNAQVPVSEDNIVEPASPLSAKSVRLEDVRRTSLAPQLPPPPRRGQRSSIGLGRPGSDRRVSSSEFDRPRRRASRLSAAPDMDMIPADEEFEEAFLEPKLPSLAKGKGRVLSGGSDTTNRRASNYGTTAAMMREDLHEYGKLNVVAEDLRETTMYMGLDEDKTLRSDTVFDRLWSWRPPPGTDPRRARVFLSENRSASFAHLNIVLPVKDDHMTCFTFQVELVSTPDARYTFTELMARSCLAAVPVFGTRSEVLDTALLDPDGSLQLIGGGSGSLPVKVPILPTADGRDEVANQFASTLSMALDGDGHAASNGRRMVDLVDASGSRVTVVYSDGERVRVSLDCAIAAGLSQRALQALSYALDKNDYSSVGIAFLAGVQELPSSKRSCAQSQWSVLSNVILQKCGLTPAPVKSRSVDPIMRRLAGRLAERSPNTSSALTQVSTNCAEVLLALHLVAQDCRLSATSELDLPLIARAILRLAAAIGRLDWVDYWQRLVPGAAEKAVLVTASQVPDTSVLDRFTEPPDILSYFSRQLVCATKAFPIPQTVFMRASPLGSPQPCLQTELLREIYSHATPRAETKGDRLVSVSCERRGLEVVKCILDLGLDKAWLHNLPVGIAMPLGELIRVCQQSPPNDASRAVYEFIGRDDIAETFNTKPSLDLPMGAEGLEEESKTIADIMASVHTPEDKHDHYSALPHVRFGLDRRLDEVERIMQTTHQRTVVVNDPKEMNEQEVQVHYQNYVNMLAYRTFAITVGQGMFQYGSQSSSISATWDIPPVDLNVKIVPANQVLQPQVPELTDWPNFHHGVAAGLSISPEVKGIDAAWMIYNRPQSFNAEHGGFLLGLGLSGHLRSITVASSFDYLPYRHEKTSIGLILGVACSFVGSEDLKATKAISLHSDAMLPVGSMPMGATSIEQSAALMGIGLLYAGTSHLRYAEIALAEISRQELPETDGFNEHREAYSFSAAMCFALIMLGRGGRSTSEVERKMVKQLTRCIYGDSPDIISGTRNSLLVDPTVTSSGATLALGLMYLRSGRRDIADLIEIPQTAFALESVRPEQLLIRTYARALIMWDDVRGSFEWLNAQIPQFIQHNDHKGTFGMELNIELAYFNIIAGAALAIGVRFASSPNESAHSVVLTLFSVLAKAAAGQSMSYEARIRRSTARQALNTVTLGMAALMAGTGELHVMRRLRVSHGQEGVGVTYGSHMAMHMALGLLFLGRGYYSLGNSNLAIAAMSIAFFPRFQPGISDNRAYPQAFRHLWALAAEPRCLIARDVDTRESIFLPIKLKQLNLPAVHGHISPTPCAPFNTIESLATDSPRYWTVKYDMSNPHDRHHIINTRTVWVKRKSAFLDYRADPRGYRSLFVRTGITSSFDMHYDLLSPAAPLSMPPTDVVDLVQSHSSEIEHAGMAKRFMGDTRFDRFVRNALFECVSLDKPFMLPYYLALALGVGSQDDLGQERMSQIAFLIQFYRTGVFDRDYAGSGSGSERRHPNLRQTFLQILGRTVRDKPEPEWEKYLRDVGERVIEVSTQLARYLTTNNVPPPVLLAALRRLVGQKTMEPVVLELKVRRAAEKYAASVARQWDQNAGVPIEAAGWKLRGAQDAVEEWYLRS